jgi:hypothetical protein
MAVLVTAEIGSAGIPDPSYSGCGFPEALPQCNAPIPIVATLRDAFSIPVPECTTSATVVIQSGDIDPGKELVVIGVTDLAGRVDLTFNDGLLASTKTAEIHFVIHSYCKGGIVEICTSPKYTVECNPCPPAGTDIFDDTEAVFVFDPPGLPPARAIVAHGPTEVWRGPPQVARDGSGACTIETEIIELSLSGVYDPGCSAVPVTVSLDTTIASNGGIASSDSAGQAAFPDTSVFSAVNVMISITAVGTFPHVVNDLESLLPDANLWTEPPCLAPDENPYQAGFPAHSHIPCPQPTLPGCCQLPAPEGGCLVTRESTCALLGGTFEGEGTVCTKADCWVPCDPVAVDESIEESSWGRVKSRYRHHRR